MKDNWMGYDPNQLIPRLRSLCDDFDRLQKGGMVMLDIEPVELENWSLLRRAVPVLTGAMTGHPHIRNGAYGATTEIYYFDKDRGLARSLSRWYRLGDPMTEASSAAWQEALLKP